jgi:DNA-binding response OmpR family regulator
LLQEFRGDSGEVVAEQILLIEDDEPLGREVVGHVGAAGYKVVWLRDGDEALEHDVRPYALVVLDLMLPRTHGFDVLKRIRERSDTPVLVLSALKTLPDKVRALGLGADDFMTKPFWPEELIARLKARLRRPEMRRGGALRFGSVVLQVGARRVEVDGRPIELTRVEFDLLAALARRPGQAVSRAWLLENVLDPDREATERVLDNHVSRVRRKLGAMGSRITTVWGVGYRLDSHDAPDAPKSDGAR